MRGKVTPLAAVACRFGHIDIAWVGSGERFLRSHRIWEQLAILTGELPGVVVVVVMGTRGNRGEIIWHSFYVVGKGHVATSFEVRRVRHVIVKDQAWVVPAGRSEE